MHIPSPADTPLFWFRRLSPGTSLALLHGLLISAAVVIWLVSLPAIDFSQMTNLGLISVLPVTIFVALGLLTVSYCLALQRPAGYEAMLVLQLVLLIVMLYGITSFVEEVPRFGTTWRHAGFTEYITRTGTVAPNLEARFNWPGFFILSALITQLAGYTNAIEFVGWAPVFFNLLYLGPLYVIFRHVASDRRVIWLGLWFFYLANWIGQDYFAPQALAYFLGLVVLSILLKWFSVPTPEPLLPSTSGRLARVRAILAQSDLPVTPSSTWQRVALAGILVATFVVMVASHQLTPQYLVLCTLVLVFLGRCRLRSLPMLQLVLIVAWIVFMTVPFLVGHLHIITGSFGQVSETVSSNVTERLRGSDERLIVLRTRLVMTTVIWALALIGMVRRARRGYWDVTYAVLAGVPFLLLFLQSYGGEAILRIYFYALPFMSFFAALLFFPSPGSGRSWRTTVVIGALSILLLGAFHVTRYGNERMDHMRVTDVAAVEYVYNAAPERSLLAVAMPSIPWRHQDYEKYAYESVQDAFLAGDIEAIATVMGNERYNEAYLLLTESQQIYAEMYLGLRPGLWEERLAELRASGLFEPVFNNGSAQIFKLRELAVAEEPVEAPVPEAPAPPPAEEQPAPAPSQAPATPITGIGQEIDGSLGVPRPTPQPAPATTPEPERIEEQVARQPYIEHTVQRGETVYALARRYDTTPEAIVALNPLIDPDSLVIGEVLRIPALANIESEPELIYITHVVQRGDILYRIAQVYNTTPEAIIALNPQIDPDSLVIGEVLRIPAPASEDDRTTDSP